MSEPDPAPLAVLGPAIPYEVNPMAPTEIISEQTVVDFIVLMGFEDYMVPRFWIKQFSAITFSRRRAETLTVAR